jgi:hypothetical protein
VIAGYDHFLVLASRAQWDEAGVDLRADAAAWPATSLRAPGATPAERRASLRGCSTRRSSSCSIGACSASCATSAGTSGSDAQPAHGGGVARAGGNLPDLSTTSGWAPARLCD